MQLRQPTTLPTDPQFSLFAGQRVDHVSIQSIACNPTVPSVFEPPKSSLYRRKPYTSLGINKHRFATFRWQAFRDRICYKGAVANAFDPISASDPKISFAVLIQGRNGLARYSVAFME